MTVMLTIGSFKVFDLILRADQRRSGPVDAGAVAVHLPEGLRGEPVRLRLGGLGRAVRHLLPRHRRPVPGQQAEERADDRAADTRRPATPGRLAGRPRRAGASAAAWRVARLPASLVVAAAALLLPFFWMVDVVAEGEQRRVHRPDQVAAGHGRLAQLRRHLAASRT